MKSQSNAPFKNEVTTMQDTIHQTTVTVQVTTIKLINEINDEIYNHTVNGKLTTAQAKTVAKEIGYTYINKEVLKDTFDVPTKLLLELKSV